MATHFERILLTIKETSKKEYQGRTFWKNIVSNKKTPNIYIYPRMLECLAKLSNILNSSRHLEGVYMRFRFGRNEIFSFWCLVNLL